jgi:hypothetical protein
MEKWKFSDLPDLFSGRAWHIAAQLTPDEYVSLQDLLNDLLARLAKLEEAKNEKATKATTTPNEEVDRPHL